MKTLNRKGRSPRASTRNGAVAVECAFVAPILVLLVLGAVDVGQFANVYQKVSDASREGARVASKNGTTTTGQVQAAVADYLAQAFPGVPSSTLASATTVAVTDSKGKSPPAGNMTSISSGSQVSVRVRLRYDLLRWVSSVPFLNGNEVEATTMMRRE